MKKLFLTLLFVSLLSLLLYSCVSDISEEYTVSFFVDGVKVSETSVVEGGKVVAPNSPTKEGYSFLGWYTESGEAWEESSHRSGSVAVFAKWSPIEYTATFKADGAIVEELLFSVETKNLTLPSVPHKNGYLGEWESFTLENSNITVNASYTAISYSIIYNLNIDEASLEPINVYTIENETFELPEPRHSQYTFIGWFANSELLGESVSEIEKGTFGDLIFYAKWAPKEYTATFVADGTLVEEVGFNSQSSEVSVPHVPEKNGYIGEWEPFVLGNEDIIVNAVYTLVEYTLSYETNLPGVKGGLLAKFTVESDDIILSALSGDNFIFISWYLDIGFINPAGESIKKGTTENIVLYAKLECTHLYNKTVIKTAETLKMGLEKYECEICAHSYEQEIPATKSIKILAIGNSFSIDSMHYLYGILKQAGVEKITMANLYIAGCTLETHWTNISGDISAYTLYTSDDEQQTMIAEKNETRSVKYALNLADWDVVTLQQSSYNSGTPSTYGALQNIIDYVKESVPGAKIYWHMTWAYAPERAAATRDFKTQIGMYNAIVDTVNEKIVKNSDIYGIIPTGTAIQNLRTSLLGTDLTRDESHLSYGVGRYTAALIWAKVLTDCDIYNIDGTPSYAPDNNSYGAELNKNIVYIREAVENAFVNPLVVTNSLYPPAEDGSQDESGENDGDGTSSPEVDFDATLSDLTADDIAYLNKNGYSPDKYKTLDITYYDNMFYDSSTGSSLKTGTGSLLDMFVGTQIFSRYELIVGSLIRIDSGSYRPEGWTSLDSETPTSNRPGNVSTKLVKVDEKWWGEFNYRGFNLRKQDGSTYSDVIQGFKIYIPVVSTSELSSEDITYLEGLGLNANEYRVLDFKYFENQFYSSTTSSSLNTPSESAQTYGQFYGIELLTRYDLTIGSVIRLESDYKYRPEGWYDLDDKIASGNREGNVSRSKTIIDAAWWKNYVYRGFNVSCTGKLIPDFDISGIRIYVKI